MDLKSASIIGGSCLAGCATVAGVYGTSKKYEKESEGQHYRDATIKASQFVHQLVIMESNNPNTASYHRNLYKQTYYNIINCFYEYNKDCNYKAREFIKGL